ncbi:MAG TPA: hypothetical protein VNL35_19780, partial [Chloroflexota bacterium]|nr:hypothetical protein [Chloroflexota bacterium]
AADAGALAGVVYLPGSTTNATNNAGLLTSANSFTDNCTASGTCGAPGPVKIAYQADGPSRTLREQITEWVPTNFLNVLDVHSIAVTRAATATYADPITLGAPDHVLGFAPYPTHAVKQCVAGDTRGTNCQSNNPYGQGFYLEVRGPWSRVENGDAFSPFFKGFSAGSGSIKTTGGATVPTLTGCNAADPGVPFNNICQAGTSNYHIQVNPMYNQQDPPGASYGGYNFVFAFPPNMTHPALIKLFDPLDECSFPSLGAPSAAPPGGSVHAWNGPPTGAPVSQTVSQQMIDQCGATFFSQDYPVTLQFTVYNPSDQLAQADKTLPATSGTHAVTGGILTVPSAANGGNGQTFGADNVNSANHGWNWFTYAEFQNTNPNKTEYVMVNIQSVIDGSGHGGEGGNDFSLGLCKAAGDSSVNSDGSPNLATFGKQTDPTQWELGSTDGRTSPTGGSATGYDLGCADPNIGVDAGGTADGYGCSDGTNTCYHVSALTAFCLETLQQTAGKALIPLAQIDQHFANADVTLRLFDAGDISGTNTVNILGPDTDPNGSITPYESFAMDLSAPANSGYSQAGMGRFPGGNPATQPNTWFGNNTTTANPSSAINACPPDYNADSYPLGNGPVCPPLTALGQTGGGINTGVNPAWQSGHAFGNGTWMDFHIHIPSGYLPPSSDQWWKVLYNTTQSADDTTTWEVVSGAAPVHLISVN